MWKLRGHRLTTYIFVDHALVLRNYNPSKTKLTLQTINLQWIGAKLTEEEVPDYANTKRVRFLHIKPSVSIFHKIEICFTRKHWILAIVGNPFPDENLILDMLSTNGSVSALKEVYTSWVEGDTVN